ncbi:MAG: preprotein translocase subunit SecG [Eubacterium sp.]|jgi:preprotein translocase subunit SecG|nr:preprotein translocase subunit SecG [Eubacterium sp.]
MQMTIIEIIGAILLILSCITIVLLVLSQDSSKGLSQSLTGSSGDNYYQKNSARTKEAVLKRVTKAATIILFVVTLAVNVFAIFNKENAGGTEDGPVVDLTDQFAQASENNSSGSGSEIDQVTEVEETAKTSVAENSVTETTSIPEESTALTS